MVEAYTATPLSPIRKVIAARMAEAKRTIPHFRLGIDIELDALLALRKQLSALEPDVKLSLSDLLIKACATALMDTPSVNIQWADTEIHQYRSADISVVTALEGGGLSTPIVRSADSKTIWQISREVKESIARAKKNALRMDEIAGGSFSISNLGMYGIDEFDAIINPPQCAILAIGSAKPRVVVSHEHGTRVATSMRVTLSVDHRAIDGATGAAFLSVGASSSPGNGRRFRTWESHCTAPCRRWRPRSDHGRAMRAWRCDGEERELLLSRTGCVR
jgi:pyruvate dehydrogenase E2 component (dihydrolipoamide acetyltransferase)